MEFKSFSKILLLNCLSGGLNFLFLYIINTLVKALINGSLNKYHYQYSLLYIITIISFILIKRLLSKNVIQFSQAILWKLRKDIIDLVLRLSLKQYAGKKDQILTVITKDVFTLTNAYMSILLFAASAISVLACCIYMAAISLPLFFITLGGILLGVTSYLISWNRHKSLFEKYRILETDFMKYLSGILDGFKEISVDRSKGDIIFEERIKPLSVDSIKFRGKSLVGFLNSQIIGQIMMFSLIGATLIYFKFLLDISTPKVISFLFVLMYLKGEIENMMTAIPEILQARIASDKINELKNLLDSETEVSKNVRLEKNIANLDFEVLELTDLAFEHVNHQKTVFSIGPLNFTIKKGEIIFVHGGNGSGKTTLIFVILGLLKPSNGGIYLDGTVISPEQPANYQTLFAVVFSDFHLFEEIYSNLPIDKDRLVRYLELFEIEKKVSLEGNRFSTTNLSTGQRKRLALISALLENKRIIVLDEWAADQDPVFRRKFYQTVLPILKDEGYTILAITHDDKYYHCADKLYRMSAGQLYLDAVNQFAP